jgi:excisionase family DNA binding protein
VANARIWFGTVVKQEKYMTDDIKNSDQKLYPSTGEPIAFVERLTCSVAEACKAIGLSRSKVYELISGGQVQSVTIGRRRLVSVSSLIRLTSQQAGQGSLPAATDSR